MFIRLDFDILTGKSVSSLLALTFKCWIVIKKKWSVADKENLTTRSSSWYTFFYIKSTKKFLSPYYTLEAIDIR